jgi:DNA-binding transcriptional ArsR family regulator
MASNGLFAEVAALSGDPARASMLHALMDGRALTATELARAAGIAPQTASGHLHRMTAIGLLSVEKQGRHPPIVPRSGRNRFVPGGVQRPSDQS